MSQEFDSNVLDLAKGLNLYQYMNCFEKIKEELPSKEKLCSSLNSKKNVIKSTNIPKSYDSKQESKYII